MTPVAPPKRLSLQEQAEYLEVLLKHRVWLEGDKDAPSFRTLSIDTSDVAVLHELVARLKRMAPHEAAIKRMVTGR